MAETIKGINVTIGSDTTGLSKALADVNKNSRDIQSELKQVERLLKFNPKDTELLAQKQKLLSDHINNTKEKLDRLKAAQEQVNEQYKKGEISEAQHRAFQRELIKTESQLKYYTDQLKQTTSRTQDFQKRMQELGSKLKDVGASMKSVGTTLTKTLTASIAGAGTGLVALSAKAGQAADRILDLKEITGMSTDTIQEWQHVATVAGVETETMTKAVEGLVRKIPQLESEGGKTTEQLEKLGLTFAELREMSPDKQVDTLMQRLSEMEDPLERNAIASQLFGGAWDDIAPVVGMGAAAMANARMEAHDLGKVMSEKSLNDANEFRIEMDKLKSSIGAAALQIGSDIAPVLRDTLGPVIKDTIIPALQNFGEKIKNLLDWFGNLSPSMQKTILSLVAVAAAIGPVLVAVGTLISAFGSVAGVLSSVIGLFGGGAAAAGAAGAAGAAAGGGGLAAVLTAITGPVGIAIAAVTALVAIGVTLYKNWDEIKEKALQLWNYLKEKFEQIKTAITSPINSAIDTLKKINLFDIGKNIINGLISGIKSMINKVKSTISSIASTITGGVKSALKISSPSRVMIDLGENTGEGFVIGLMSTIGELEKQTKKLSGAAIPQISNGGGGLTVINQGTVVGRGGMEEFADIISRRLAGRYGIGTGGAY